MPIPLKLRWDEIEVRAITFSKEYESAASEKSQKGDFVRAFLRVFGVEKNVGEFEKTIKVSQGRSNFIDFYWKGHIAIEMKSKGKRLDNAFEQLSGYMAHLPEGDTPPNLWMVSDFENIHLYHRPTGQEFGFKTQKLRKYIRHFALIAGYEFEQIRSDKEGVNVQAAEKMAKLFDALKSYKYDGHELQVYMARLLFCLFADDTGIFPQDSFYQYISESKDNGSDLSGRLGQLFQDLNKPVDARISNPFLTEHLRQDQFRHINGGLFEERLELASFDKKMRQTLLDCLDFDWSKINPAIFGSMFQGVMDSGHRREIGAHYTAEENILKLINPLFMDELRAEFKRVKKKASLKALSNFHDKIAKLKFLDPACGCGNFLIIAYRELRLLEIEILREQWRLSKTQRGNDHLLLDIETILKINVEQFYGIEILSWPCQIAKTGMWLMDHLMNIQVSEKFGQYYDRLPLTKGAEIVHDNAHRIDWESIVPKDELSYILGNPPYVGYSNQSAEQKEDMLSIYLDSNGKPFKNAGKIDYVSAWFYRASKYIAEANTRAAFVSTNSVTQGEQVAAVWKPLFEIFGIHIDFAYRTFKWSNEARGKAAVHCVIIGFSTTGDRERVIYDGGERVTAKNISPYLVDGPVVFVESRKTPLCDVPLLITGNRPADGGHLIIEDDDLADFIKADPLSKKYIRQFMGSEEFINNRKRWCLWLVGVSPEELRRMPNVMKRIAACKKDRERAPDEGRRKLAKTPALFREQTTSEEDFIVIPAVSSERRDYVPIGFLSPPIIVSNLVTLIPNAALYHFGILMSCVHMAWTRVVCGRLKSDYRYSKDIVYNNFPWPVATDKQKAEIERLAQGVLDARAKYPDSSLADLYDPLTMPPELLRAHNALDRAVMKLYGFDGDTPEPAIVAELMQMYQRLTVVK